MEAFPREVRKRKARRAGTVLVLLWLGINAALWLPRVETSRLVSPGNDGWQFVHYEFKRGLLHYAEGAGYRILQNGVDRTGRFNQSTEASTLRMFGLVWSIAISVVLTLGVWLLPLWIERRVVAVGRCMSCGYDLRNLTSEQCPECGVLNSKRTIDDL